MTKHTKRDYVWTAALHLRDEVAGSNRRFGVDDIREHIEEMYAPGIDGPPGEQAVHDVLVTMYDLGELDGRIENPERSAFAPPPQYRRPCEDQQGVGTLGQFQGTEQDQPRTLD